MVYPSFSFVVRRALLALACLAPMAAHPNVLFVEAPTSRSAGAIADAADNAVRGFGRSVARLTAWQREFIQKTTRKRTFVSLPSTVVITQNGVPQYPPAGSGRANDLNLVFDPARKFTPDYENFLAAVFATVESRLTATFGDPSIGGNVIISSYDADIGDRDAVAGGYFFYDPATQTQQIRFPEYSDAVGIKFEVAAVNFVHTLLLAYMGPKYFPFDAFTEGLVRAATMKIVRTPGALPAGLDPDLIEQVLDSTYDVGPYYDWCNQPGLGGPTFIAPNLRAAPLPIGGAVGGLYLVRYQMAGSAFLKVLGEHPNFAKEFLVRYYANPSQFTTEAQLAALGQIALNAAGGPNSTVEGRPFAEWHLRQHILDTTLAAGTKLMVQPFAITDNLSGGDFGVFGIQAHLFRTDTAGNETLLRETSYPIYWSPDFTRVFTSAQDDRMDIFQGYGSVAPNFVGSAFNNEPYRVTVDIPVLDQIERVYLPAGAIATPANPTASTVFGCLTGIESGTGISYRIALTWAGGATMIPVLNGAFGAVVTDGNFLREQARVRVDVIQTKDGADATVLTRWVNKAPGALGLTLHVDALETLAVPGGVRKGISLVGVQGRPYRASVRSLLGDAALLGARWNPTRSRFEFLPEFAAATPGVGFFARPDANLLAEFSGLAVARTPVAIALKPGWNLITNPLLSEASKANIQVVVKDSFPRTFEDAILDGQIGADIFEFLPGANDAFSGAPEKGTLIKGDTFRPGVGVYLRVFAPTGATLLFTPGLGQTRGPGLPKPTWSLNFSLSAATGKTKGETTSVQLARAKQATRGYDNTFDSELPPTMGGLQASLTGPNPLFRDTRGFGSLETYSLTLKGLEIGATYEVKIVPTIGKAGRFTVIDPKLPLLKRFVDKGSYRFKAKTATRIIKVSVPR